MSKEFGQMFYTLSRDDVTNIMTKKMKVSYSVDSILEERWHVHTQK